MTQLNVGDHIPPFKGVDQHQNVISAKDYKGKKLVMYFYPKDNTPGCTEQACNLRDQYEDLLKAGISIIGISADSVKSHQKFASKFELPFPLIADEDKVIINEVGVWGAKKFMGREFEGIHRTTFLINEEGNIVHVIEKPKTKNHAEEILEWWHFSHK